MSYKMNVGNSPYGNANVVAYDTRYNELVYASVISYHHSIKDIVKAINKKNQVYVERVGYFQSAPKIYEILTAKQSNSEFTHAIIYKKDEVYVGQNETETLSAYVFVNDLADDYQITSCLNNNVVEIEVPDSVQMRVYDKLYKHTAVPILVEWMPYVIKQLVAGGKMRELRTAKPSDIRLKVYHLRFAFKELFDIVSKGLENRSITICGATETPEDMMEIRGLDDYLNSKSEILADRIQQSFVPKFVPGIDTYSENLQAFDGYNKRKGLSLYPAQKDVIQAASNNLDKNNVSFITAEMGSGKTAMGIGTIYTNHKKEGTTNIVLCPSHLVYKWKNEVERCMPLSQAVVVEDFNHFMTLLPLIKNPLRRRHLFLIMSKETAKFGYELRPAAVWSDTKRAYVCPTCGQVLYWIEVKGSGRRRQEIRHNFTERSFAKENQYNLRCMNQVKVWNEKDKKWDMKDCQAKLWTPIVKSEESWFKMGEKQGWIERKHMQRIFDNLVGMHDIDKKNTEYLSALSDALDAIKNDSEILRAPRKYPIASYIRRYLKGCIDYFVADEMHLYKAGDSSQGQAFSDLVQSANKTIGLTGTLLNGYANGLFYILYRCYPDVMRKEGYSYKDETSFTRDFGVIKKTTKYRNGENGRQGNRFNSTEKALPGVSPLVFTKFLLENAAFLSLSDISEGLPEYQEIPVAVDMDRDLYQAYRDLESDIKDQFGWHKPGGAKTLSQMMQLLAVYPDMPYQQPPVIHPESGEIILTPPELNTGLRNKERRLLQLVKDKLAAGEKVLVYYHWTDRTDCADKLLKMLKDEGIKAAVLKSSTVSSKDREEWIQKQVEGGLDVLLCNPTLVETGLDLLAFTTIIFYQVGYNLFTMRQASRRSWRLSQSKDIEVYFLYYRDTVQEQALSLMATKLQASQAIEGKFSEEGLHAMSNNEDILTQIANSVVQGIKHTVNVEVFQKVSVGRRGCDEACEVAEKVEVFNGNNIVPYSIFRSLQDPKRKLSKTQKVASRFLDNPLLVANFW